MEKRALANAVKKPGKARTSASRGERLSAALRENLKRRKAQARGRAAEPGAQKAREDIASEPFRQTPDFRRNQSRD